MKAGSGKKGSRNVVALGGALTVSHASELKETLLRSLKDSRPLKLVFNEVTEVDLSFLQLLCSAHRSAKGLGKNLTLSTTDLPLKIKELAVSVGFPGKMGCEGDCLWAQAGTRQEGKATGV